MGGGEGKSNTLWIVLGVLGAVSLLCCGGVGVMGFFGARQVANNLGGFEEGLREIVADLAGESGAAAEEVCTVFLAEHQVDDAWERTSEEFRATTDRDGLQGLHDRVAGVMGDLESMRIRTYDVNTRVGSRPGKLHSLVYDGTFANGDATIAITLREAEGEFLLERIDVDSPLFAARLNDTLETPDGDAANADSPAPDASGASDTGTEASEDDE